MKILDYITLLSAMEKKLPSDLTRFAADIEADVYPVEQNGVLVICEADKVDAKIKSGKKFDMYALCSISKGHITGSNDKGKLIQHYALLLKDNKIHLDRVSSSCAQKLQEEFGTKENWGI